MTNAQKLHQEFIRLGGTRHKLKNRMLALLPEIYKSGIYKKYAGSIVEYAGKFGDIAGTTVIKRLRLEKNLEDKPCLKAAIEKVGVHKVALVAKIATFETDKAFAENISNMSRVAVQSLSKELRGRESENSYGQLSLGCNADEQPREQLDFEGSQTQACRAVPRITKIELDEESTFLLMKLKAKLGKHLSDKEFLKLILKDRIRMEFPKKTEKSKKKMNKEIGLKVALHREDMIKKSITGDTSRYISTNKKRQIIAQTNGKCSYPNCNSPFQIFHHVNRFSESKSHDSVILLCKIHHEFAHNNLIQNEKLNSEKWKLSISKPSNIKISQADIFYKKYREKIFV